MTGVGGCVLLPGWMLLRTGLFLVLGLALLVVAASIAEPVLAQSLPTEQIVQSEGVKQPLITSKIINGTRTNPDDYPYMASIRYPIPYTLNGQDVGGRHSCGGTLIAPNIVLTAGHCIPQGFTSVEVHIGRHAREGDDGERFQTFQTKEIRVHPEFDMIGGWSNFDVALLVLDGESPTTPTGYVKNEESLTAGKIGTVIGWGLTEEDNLDSQSDLLLQADIPFVSRDECKTFFDHPSLITPSMVCAGKKGTDACIFDSGGPLLVERQVGGIVSWGDGCGGEKPGVYANVGALSSWIDSQIQAINNPDKGTGCLECF